MKPIRLFLVALAAFFLNAAIAQTCLVYEWSWNNLQTNTTEWNTSGQTACFARAASVMAKNGPIYWANYDVVMNEKYWAEPLCNYNFKLTHKVTGVVSFTALSSEVLQKRCVDCVGGISDREEWGGWLPSTDPSPSWGKFFQETVGSQVTPKERVVENCQVNLDIFVGFVAAGQSVNGWTPYASQWRGNNTGVVDPNNSAPYVIPAVPINPPVDPDDPNNPDDPDNPDDPLTPLTCSAPPDFYAEQYPAGIQGVWDGLKNGLLSSALWVGVTHLVPNFQSSTCPAIEFPAIDFPGIGYHAVVLQVPCMVWDAIKAIFLLTASFFAFRLIFGGA